MLKKIALASATLIAGASMMLPGLTSAWDGRGVNGLNGCNGCNGGYDPTPCAYNCTNSCMRPLTYPYDPRCNGYGGGCTYRYPYRGCGNHFGQWPVYNTICCR